MSEHIEKTIGDLQQEIRRDQERVAETKRTVNKLRKMIGQQPIYPDAENAPEQMGGPIRPDRWYGIGISTAMREFLEMRRAANLGPATVGELYSALSDGGYRFGSEDEENAKRGLRISLTKNTSIFHRLPDGKHYGLLDWYPEVKARKAKEPGENEDDGKAADDDGEPKEDRKTVQQPQASTSPRSRMLPHLKSPGGED
jgi:hypothetical protein